MLLLVFLGVFAFGFTIQACMAAADYAQTPPAGQIYSVNVNGLSVRMHMYCIGASSSNATFLFEHGGGANSVSGMPLQSSWAAAGRRACVYDRLGYGWTPSMLKRSDLLRPTSGQLLVQLLRQAGERGPFVCIGHSAGAAACVEFALAANSTELSVVGVAMLDGYPDVIRAGSLRPGSSAVIPASTMLQQLQGYAVMVGPTGLSRGQLGAVDPSSFGLPSRVATYKALYSQSRFWLSQYFDVVGDTNSGSGGYLFSRIPGAFRDSQNLFHYANAFPFRVIHIPAFSTVNTTCVPRSSDYCCSPYGINSPICVAKRQDSLVYLAQANLYASTLGSSGRVIIGPQGSEHSFVYTTPYTSWIASTILQEFA